MHRLDLGAGDSADLDALLAALHGPSDFITLRRQSGITLWHLLPRVPPELRQRVYEHLAELSPPPAGVTGEGILALRRPMLEQLAEGIESAVVQGSPDLVDPRRAQAVGTDGRLTASRFVGERPHVMNTLLRRLGVTVLLGAGTGAVFLGLGGRIVMSVFALATSRPPVVTLRGTITVTVAGAIAGAIGGLLFTVVRRWLRGRDWMRGAVFAALCYGLATPGFRPPWPLVFALFAPVFLACGAGLVMLEARVGTSPFGPARAEH